MTDEPAQPGVPDPPARLDCNLMDLPAGTRLHRIHATRHGPSSFNPGSGGDSRFAPIRTPDGVAIPTLYAGTSFGCATFETVFHGIEPDAAFKSVRWTTLEALSYSTLETTRPLTLARLFTPDLLKWGCARRDLIDTAASAYPNTRRWAVAIHEAHPAIDGMIWTSRRFDEDRALVLFGTRVADESLATLASARLTQDKASLEALHGLARRAGILIAR